MLTPEPVKQPRLIFHQALARRGIVQDNIHSSHGMFEALFLIVHN